MKKIILSLMLALTLSYSSFIFSSSTVIMTPQPYWTGFYLGGNVGYGWSQNNKVVTTGSSSFINQTFTLGSSNIVNALIQIATNHFSLHSYGFIGGGQVGYNYQFDKKILMGFDADLDGLTNSNNTYTLQKSVNLIDFNENYVSSMVIKQKINYLGTLRARLGYLYHPTFLIYVTGGLAYGNVKLDTTWTAQESLGTVVFPAINTQNNLSKTLIGWTAGSGIEWLFKPNWSAKLEYSYYYLNRLNAPVMLAQINGSTSPPILWASTATNTALSVSVGTIRVGLNYHF